jgi:hypothetical protein
MRTALENPMGFSKGDPEEMFWRMMVFLLWWIQCNALVLIKTFPISWIFPHEADVLAGDFPLLFIFFPVEENEPKEDALVPLSPARRRSGRSTRELARL